MFVKDVLDLGIVGGFFVYSQEKFPKTLKTRRLSKEEIKQQVVDSIINNDIIETKESNEKSDKADKPEYATALIKQYQDIIHTKKKKIISSAYHQGKIFKRFKDKKKFIKIVIELKLHKSAIIFKINIVQLIDKQRKFIRDIRFIKKLFQGC